MKNPYKILGVKETASLDEIKKAYRTLAKKHHPDLNPSNKTNEAKFKEISHAYDQIGTNEARTKFDQGEPGEENSKQQWSSFYNTQQNAGRYANSYADQFGDDEFFENLFHGAHQKRRAQNQDINYLMDLTLEEAVLGVEKVITLANGKNLKVKIPPGITSGTKLRFAGHGLTENSGPPGNAYIMINVLPKAGYIVQGHDIETELPISFMEALLGAEIEVPTLYGSVNLQIPPNVSTGSKLRIKGKGIITNTDVGSQIVKIKVVLPKKSDPELLKAIKSWNGKYDYNPRGEK